MPANYDFQIVYEDDPEVLERFPDGSVRQGLKVTFTGPDADEAVGMLRHGYMCANCLEWPLESAFPDGCPVCGYPMRAHQSQWFAQTFFGDRQLGPSFDWDEETDRLERQRHDREAREGLRARGVWVPGDA